MNLGELYKSFTYDPTAQKHVLIAEPMYKAMTGKPLTAKLEHSSNMEHLGVYLPVPNICRVRIQANPNRMLTVMGHELGHAAHRVLIPSRWEEEQTVLFELWYTRKLEEMLDRPFERNIGEESVWYNHVPHMQRLTSQQLQYAHDNFEQTVELYELPLRKPICYKLGL